MRRKQKNFLLFAISATIIFASCTSQKKIVSTQQEIATKDTQLIQYNKVLQELQAQLQKKKERNEIDDTASVRIQRFIGLSTAEIEKLLAKNSILVGKTNISRADWQELKKNLQLTEELSKMLADKVGLITDLINRDMVVKLDQDVIFESGQYHVAPASAGTIAKTFEPAASDIELFIKNHPGIPLSIVITANGYADGTSIAEGSSLYKDLKAGLNLTNPTSKELNQRLSWLRAQEVMGLFKKFFDARPHATGSIKSTLYFYDGKGEALPNPKIADYKIDDPRRRVVLLYWSVFPE